MPRKRTGYDAACYYDGKLLGRCTKADSDAYTLLMNACGGEAARVLREYAYFSPELKAILEKAALMQADRSRTGGMFHAPKSSPWGEVQSCETLCPGVFLVYHYFSKTFRFYIKNVQALSIRFPEIRPDSLLYRVPNMLFL